VEAVNAAPEGGNLPEGFGEHLRDGAEGVPAGMGAVLREARIAQGLSLYALAFDLNLSVHLLEAIETEAWDRLPPGRERPYVRQVAERLGVDPGAFAAQWSRLPGASDPEAPDPRREHQERVLMGVLSAGTVLLALWLVVPGRSLRQPRTVEATPELRSAQAPWKPSEPAGPNPVLGEVLPEVPVNEEGVLVLMRSQDACEVTVARDGDPAPPQKRTLRVSEPWRLRVKGPFSITLENAGVVILDVAGHRIRQGAAVGETWTGYFQDNGEWIPPMPPEEKNPPSAPESDPSVQEGE
jgi:transcriptional regulator with XRE-family HTH domain